MGTAPVTEFTESTPFQTAHAPKCSKFVSTDAAAQTENSHSLFWLEFRRRFRFRLAILKAELLGSAGSRGCGIDVTPDSTGSVRVASWWHSFTGVWIRAENCRYFRDEIFFYCARRSPSLCWFPHIFRPHLYENKAIAHIYYLFTCQAISAEGWILAWIWKCGSLSLIYWSGERRSIPAQLQDVAVQTDYRIQVSQRTKAWIADKRDGLKRKDSLISPAGRFYQQWLSSWTLVRCICLTIERTSKGSYTGAAARRMPVCLWNDFVLWSLTPVHAPTP